MPHCIRASFACCALLGANTAHALDDTRLREALDTTIRPLMARYEIPGMAVGLVVEGRALVFNYGVAAQQTQNPVTDTTRFEIGSVSKVFAATLAAYAQSTGQLSLNDHPSRFVPALKGTGIDRATLLHLATYTGGGLPLQFPEGVTSDADALAYLQHWKPLARPGTQRSYSNPSIGLLGRVTATALGQDYATAVETRLFPAFGMAHSQVHDPVPAGPDDAWGHRDGQQVRMNRGPFAEPAYGVRTTAADLLRFVQANLAPSTLPPPWRHAVEATQVGYFRAGPLVQGLGWEQYPYPVSREWLLGGNSEEMIFDPQPAQALPPATTAGPRLFGKTGSTGGFGAYVAFVPSQHVGIVLLANRSYPIPARIEAAWTLLRAATGSVR